MKDSLSALYWFIGVFTSRLVYYEHRLFVEPVTFINQLS